MPTPDAYVKSPELLISNDRKIISLRFETMTKACPEGSGERHLITMTTKDAMRVLALLQNAQEHYHLPVLLTPPDLIANGGTEPKAN